ncbi:MAG: hypothetical protein JSR45_14875 [Proteobacteria bacterium]|nr:hypothetical protein [Pseudomonadota bacterium]
MRPEQFLFPPWRGSGVYCDAFGLPAGKYQVWGQGRREADLVVIDFDTLLDVGVANHFEWVFAPGDGLELRFSDRVSGQEATGQVTAEGFGWEWKLLHKTPLGLRRCQVSARFELTGPNSAVTSTTISLWGVSVGSSSSHIRHTS